MTSTWAIESTSETIKQNSNENSKQLTVHSSYLHGILAISGTGSRPIHASVSLSLAHRGPNAVPMLSLWITETTKQWILELLNAATPQLTTSMSIERQGNCFLVNFILMDFIEYLSTFNAFANCSGQNVSQISLNLSSTPSIENCSKKSTAPTFAHTNGTEFTVAPPTLLKPMPLLLMLHTARFDILASVTMMAVANRVRINFRLEIATANDSATYSRNPSCTLDRLKLFWTSLWWLNFSILMARNEQPA